MSREIATTFDCSGDSLVGIAHLPEDGGSHGVVVVVGGPQYRVGSHRQFVLLARHLAAAGIPVFRFDYRGLGDSAGAPRNFLQLDDDISSAIDSFFDLCPELDKVSLWSLCDAVPAALLYAWHDARLASLILLNPWVRSEESLARAYLSSYYWDRLTDPRSWVRTFSSFAAFSSRFGEVLGRIRTVLLGRSKPAAGGDAAAGDPGDDRDHVDPLHAPYREWMLSGLNRFAGRVLFVLSGNDLTATEFRDLVRSDRRWEKSVKRDGNDWQEIDDANHTFSTRQHRDRVAALTAAWITSL